jgi:hypothetical protein
MPTMPCPGAILNVNSEKENLNSITLKLGREDLNSNRTYTFDLPKNVTYEITGEDASSGYIDFYLDKSNMFRLINSDYALEKNYALRSYANAYAVSFVGDHTNALFILEPNYQTEAGICIDSLKIDGQKVFNSDTILNPNQIRFGAADIKLEQKLLEDTIFSPYIIEGQVAGWYFEGSFPIKLLDANNKEIAVAIAEAQGDWMTEEFVPFKAKLEFLVDKDQEGTLIFMKDNPSDLPEYDEKYVVSVNLKGSEVMTIKVFFGNSIKNPEAFDCSLVFPVERKILKTATTARASIEELLKGPSTADAALGNYTNINYGSKIQKLTISNGVAKVDFNDVLEKGIGGSCLVSSIRSQITQTLKQFPSIKDVVISINGRTEDILQP